MLWQRSVVDADGGDGGHSDVLSDLGVGWACAATCLEGRLKSRTDCPDLDIMEIELVGLLRLERFEKEVPFGDFHQEGVAVGVGICGRAACHGDLRSLPQGA
jgi:hypothetical protein